MNDFQERFEQMRDKDFWLKINSELHISDHTEPITIEPVAIDPKLLEAAKESLKAEGYFQLEQLLDKDLVRRLAKGVENVFKAGWPTPFVIVYDEYWELFYSLKKLFEAILGDNYKQVPNFWCWYVDTNKHSKGWGHHRDRPSVNTVLEETGLPASLTTWIPLSNATPANGCIYIVPSEHDLNYPPGDLDKRDHHELQNIRALPAQEGDVLGWTEALLHWGSRSSNKATNPRVSISFTFQRADKNAYEIPLYEPSQYQSFNQRLGLIAQNVCNYQRQAPTTPEILYACRRLSGLIPTISIQDGAERDTIEEDKRLSESILWEMQKDYFSTEHKEAWRQNRFYSTNRMIFVESYVELANLALLDCAAIIDQENPLYIIELGGGSGCFAYRFLNEFVESREDFETVKTSNVKYILTDFCESIVNEWRENKNLSALVEQGILDFAVFQPQTDKSIELLVAQKTLTPADIKNPLIVIANHVFDSIEQDAFRTIRHTLQESKITLYRESKDGTFDENLRFNDVKITERFIDLDGSYYNNPVFDTILHTYQDELEDATFTFPIGALTCIENLSNFCGEKLILLSADEGYCDLTSEKISQLKPLDFARDGSISFELNFDALRKYFQSAGGTSLIESTDYAGLRVAFHSLIQNRFQATKHFFRHHLINKNFLDSELQIADLIRNGLTAGDYDSSRVSLFLSIVRTYNYDPVMFSAAHKVLLDERFKDLEEMNKQVAAELRETVKKTTKNIYIIDDNFEIFDSILRLYIQLDWFEECLRFCEEILEQFGDVRTAIDHAALSCESLKKHREAYQYFQRSSRREDTDYEWANAGMMRAAKFLIKDGDSIVKFTIARAK